MKKVLISVFKPLEWLGMLVWWINKTYPDLKYWMLFALYAFAVWCVFTKYDLSWQTYGGIPILLPLPFIFIFFGKDKEKEPGGIFRVFFLLFFYAISLLYSIDLLSIII